MRKPIMWPRHWHANLAIALMLPFLIIAITGALFAHGNTLGLRQIRIPVAWLPAYGIETAQEIRSAAHIGEIWWLVTSQGLVKVNAGQALLIPALAQEDIRSLISTPKGLLVVTSKGLWHEKQEKWTKILSGPVMQASADGQTLTASLRGKGIYSSHDEGASWQPLSLQIKDTLKLLPAAANARPELTAAQLVHDLHTGKAFFTEKAAWLWQDFLALVLSFLAISGFYMWWTKRRARMATARAR